MDIENIEMIIKKNKPIIYFHKDEKYFPCDADYFVKNSYLIQNNRIIDKNMTQEKLYKIQDSEGTFIQPFNENVIYGFKHYYEDAPLYYFVRDEPNLNKLYIYFFLFFGYNGSYNILNLCEIGEHYNDIEHFTFEINKNNNSLERVFFSAHGSDEGIWKHANSIEYYIEPTNVAEKVKRPIIYCAKNQHGFYPKPGCIFRMFGFANDLTNKGFRYSNYDIVKINKPNDINFNPNLYGWFYSNIRFGFDGTKQIYMRRYLIEEDKGANHQKIIQENVYNISQNIVYLTLFLIIMYCIEKYINIRSRINKTLFVTLLFVSFIIFVNFIKETLLKL